MAQDDVSVQFGADTRGAEEGSKKVAESIEQLKSKVEGIQETFKKVGEIIGVAFTIDAVKEFVSGMAELGEQLIRTSAMLGMSVEQVGELKFIAEATGGSLESMSLGLERLAFNMERSAAGSKTEAEAFDRLGVSWKDASGNAKTLDQMMGDIADAFAKHADGAEKTALAIQLFGRAGANLIPVLNQGRAGLQDLREQARQTGDVFTEKMAAGMEDTHLKIVTLGATMEGFGAKLFTLLKPAIDAVITSITNLLKAADPDTMKAWVQGIADFILQIMWAIGSLIIWVTARLQVLTTTFDDFIQKAAVFAGGAAVGGATMGPIGAIVGGGAALLGANIATGLTDGVDEGVATAEKNMNATLGEWIANTQDTIHSLLDKGLGAMTGGDNILASYGASLGGKKPSFSAPIDTTQIAELKKALGEVQKTFEGVFSSIISGFDKAISGLITGTMTWKQAMFSVLGSIWQEFVKLVEQMLAKWLAGEATKTVATLTGVDARAAAEVAGQTTAGAAMIANAIKVIFVDAQKTFAGVFGFLSGLMGPFAAGPAAAAGATVAAVAGALPSFAMGSWKLPSDMIAQVHKDEMIVPAQQAESMRQGGGMSGSDLDRLVNKLVPHLKASANASRAMQRNVDNRLRTLRGAT